MLEKKRLQLALWQGFGQQFVVDAMFAMNNVAFSLVYLSTNRQSIGCCAIIHVGIGVKVLNWAWVQGQRGHRRGLPCCPPSRIHMKDVVVSYAICQLHLKLLHLISLFKEGRQTAPKSLKVIWCNQEQQWYYGSDEGPM